MVKPPPKDSKLETLVGTPHEVLQQAVRHYNAGEFTAAMAICREVIAHNQANAEALYILANIGIQTGEDDEAVGLLVRAVNIDPANAKFIRGFAEALERTGRTKQAIHAWKQYIALAPDVADAPPRLAILLVREDRIPEAIDAFRRARELAPSNAEICYNLAVALQQTGQSEAAAVEFEAALKVRASRDVRAECHIGLTAALRESGRYTDAVNHGKRAVQVAPDSFMAHNNLGLALLDNGDPHAAVTALEKACGLRPDNPEILNNFGVVLTRVGRRREARASFDRVLKLRPGWAEGHLNLANLLRQEGELDAAIEHYQTALAARPDDFRIQGSLALAQLNLDQPHEAIATYGRALALAPKNPELLTGLGIAQLLTGNFHDGWRHYEFRRHCQEHVRRSFAGTRWNGDALNGGSLLVYSEQGFGDSLQFCRYLPLVLARANADRIVFECQRPLCDLMHSLAGTYDIVARGDPLPETDHHIGLMSLPGLFGTTEPSIPNTTPYLSSPPEGPTTFDEQLTVSKPRIGFVWAGNPLRQDDTMRSCPIEAFEPLLAIAGARIHSLQQSAGDMDQERLRHHGAVDLAPHIDDFSDTAAAVSAMDLVISVDTATAHLAGALGKPVWVLLGHAADWRYLRNRDDSPWYPGMRLFRQGRRGDWHGLIRRVTATLIDEFSI